VILLHHANAMGKPDHIACDCSLCKTESLAKGDKRYCDKDASNGPLDYEQRNLSRVFQTLVVLKCSPTRSIVWEKHIN